jgi:hypothetical protein
MGFAGFFVFAIVPGSLPWVEESILSRVKHPVFPTGRKIFTGNDGGDTSRMAGDVLQEGSLESGSWFDWGWC